MITIKFNTVNLVEIVRFKDQNKFKWSSLKKDLEMQNQLRFGTNQ